MADLSQWRPVSTLPPVRRDISIVIDADHDDETIGDKVRASLTERIDDIETVTVVARTPHEALPVAARDRLGTRTGQVNALVRIVIRPLSRTLTDEEANHLRDQIYLAVHEGPHLELITPARPSETD
jgi:phenylalanyl-tRNA synthetase alpha chain